MNNHFSSIFINISKKQHKDRTIKIYFIIIMKNIINIYKEFILFT